MIVPTKRNHTATGVVTRRRTRPTGDCLWMTRLSAPPTPSRNGPGRPHSRNGSGLGSNSSGGAIMMSSKCWIMCMKNNCWTRTSNGERSAMPMTSRPAMYDTGRHGALRVRQPVTRPPRARSRRQPARNSVPRMSRGMMTSGRQLHDESAARATGSMAPIVAGKGRKRNARGRGSANVQPRPRAIDN